MTRAERWPALMTRETAADYIDGTLRDIDDLAARQEITKVGDQKRIKFRRTDLDEWVARQPDKAVN